MSLNWEVHQGYGASTVVNLIYRKRDENGNNIKRPKSVIHKLSDGNIVNLYGAKIEILEFDSNTITLVVKKILIKLSTKLEVNNFLPLEIYAPETPRHFWLYFLCIHDFFLLGIRHELHWYC